MRLLFILSICGIVMLGGGLIMLLGAIIDIRSSNFEDLTKICGYVMMAAGSVGIFSMLSYIIIWMAKPGAAGTIQQQGSGDTKSGPVIIIAPIYFGDVSSKDKPLADLLKLPNTNEFDDLD